MSVAGLLLLAASPQIEPDAVAQFACDTKTKHASVPLGEIADAYARRSVTIVRAALAGERTGLEPLIEPDAKFDAFAGDVGLGSRQTGVSAAIEFIQRLAPAGYQVSLNVEGPIAGNPCDIATSELMLFGAPKGAGWHLRFHYRGGILMNVDGNEVTVEQEGLTPTRP